VQPLPGGGVNIDPCSMGRDDAQPNVTRWHPNGRVWPGGKIVFEGQGLDPSRFTAVIGSAPLMIPLTIVSATTTRVEAAVPTRPEGGPFTPAAGDRLTVAYKGAAGCRVLNPSFVVADAFTVRTQTAGLNRAYFWIRHQMNLDGEIEGVRSLTILNRTDRALRDRALDVRGLCDWNELRPSSRTITFKDNRIQGSAVRVRARLPIATRRAPGAMQTAGGRGHPGSGHEHERNRSVSDTDDRAESEGHQRRLAKRRSHVSRGGAFASPDQ
jgi:hypothetical protein